MDDQGECSNVLILLLSIDMWELGMSPIFQADSGCKMMFAIAFRIDSHSIQLAQ